MKKRKILLSFLRILKGRKGYFDYLTMSQSGNGHDRERAVRYLGELGNPHAIPTLIVRVNDWVPQVRSAAVQALEKLLKYEHAEAFVFNLAKLYHLQHCVRADHAKLMTKVMNFLLEPDNVGFLKLAIQHDDPYVARIAVKLCIENELINTQELVLKCLSHRDVVVRMMALNLLHTCSGYVLELCLAKAIKDPLMPIRRDVFQLYLKTKPEKGLEIAHKFLFDRHVSIREIAIKQLLLSGVDVAQRLNDVLASEASSALKLKCAILGLVELDSKGLSTVIAPFSKHAFASVRKASLQALVKLISAKDVKPYLLHGLEDKSLSVSKASSRLFNKFKVDLSVDELLEIVEKNHDSRILSICMSSAAKINKWDRLIFILSLFEFSLAEGSAVVVDAELTRWDDQFNRSNSQFSGVQVARIQALYAQLRPQFSEQRRRSLDFTLRGLER